MPIFIKTGFWKKASKSFKGWLNLDDHINNLAQNSIDDVKVIQVTGLTLLSTGWTLVGSLYEYDLADSNIEATSSVEIIPDNADYTTVMDAIILPRTDAIAGSVKIYATNAPTADIGVTINITKVY